MDLKFTKIIIPTTPHADVIAGIFLLKKFGNEKYPDIINASIEILQQLPGGETSDSLEKKGIIVLDVGKGKFDHHGKDSNLSQLIADDLGILKEGALVKLLSYAERDDKYGLGTISTDQIDKAFGLSGLITALNKGMMNPEKVISIIFPLLEAHYNEERKRVYDLPIEFKKRLQDGKAEIFEVKQAKKKLKVAIIESDDVSMPGWLKSSIGIKADIVCQRKTDGFTNIITNQLKKVDLRWLVAYLRDEEFKLKNKGKNILINRLMTPGKVEEVPEWYYDRATNSILNGGANPKGIPSTAIPLKRIKEIIEEAIPR